MICKLVGSPFYIFEYSFNGVALAMRDVVKAEVIAGQRHLQPRRPIDEKQRVVDGVFCAEFAQKPLGERDRTGRMEPDVQKFVGRGIDRR
jgi:hypothetical protein